MRRVLALLLLCAAPAAAADGDGAPCTILLHGLARTDASMLVMEEALTRAGHAVVNAGYPSTRDGIEKLARATLPDALAACGDAATVNFVTHSLGGILLRVWARDHALPPGRTVMLGPPNRGSELVDELGGIPPFDWLNGPAGSELGTDGLPATLGPVWPGVGVIAGDQSLSALYSLLLPGPDDGKVTVRSTRVAGMDDHLVVPATHTFMMNAPVVIAETLAFLRDGRFARDVGVLEAVEELSDL